MYFILDVIAVIILVFSVISCCARGFFKSFFSMAKVAVSIGVAYIFMPTLAYFFRTSFIEKSVSKTVVDRLDSLTQKTTGGADLEKLFNDMPTEFADILDRYGVSAESLSERFGGFTNAAEESINDLAASITENVVHTISEVLAFAALFIGTFIVLTIVIWIMGFILKLPVLSTIDKGLGFLFGIITGVLAIWVYCNLVSVGVEALSAVKPGLMSDNVISNTLIVDYISSTFPFGFAK